VADPITQISFTSEINYCLIHVAFRNPRISA
jgi:hypothetical protein